MTQRHVLVANALQALHRTVAGVTAPNVNAYPTSLETASLPFIMAWPASGEQYQKGGGYAFDNRTFEVYGYIQAVNQDDVPSRAEQAMTVLGDITDLYLLPANLTLLDPGVAASEGYHAVIESGNDVYRIPDGGITAPLVYGGRNYIGFRISVRVSIQWLAT